MNGYDRRLCDAAWTGDLAMLEALLTEPLTVANGDPDTALMHAAHRGHAEAVRLLLAVGNPLARTSEALWRAARHRRARCIDLLYPLSDPAAWAQWQWDDLPVVSIARIRRLHTASTARGTQAA